MAYYDLFMVSNLTLSQYDKLLKQFILVDNLLKLTDNSIVYLLFLTCCSSNLSFSFFYLYF